MITKQDYMSGKNTHEEYYDQFLTTHMIGFVSERIGRERILASEDPHLNDIPLHEWNRLNNVMKTSLDLELWSKSGNGVDSKGLHVNEYTGRYYWSPSVGVCLAKAAARRLIKNNAKYKLDTF